MKKYIAAICGAALVIGAASMSLAQRGSGDPKGGEGSTTSAHPDPDNPKSKDVGKGKAKVGKKTGAPSGDPKSGESSTQSANPNPDKRK